ncbi:MAG: cofactor-independent phosphoglycerate mutase [Sedimentisphaerales bacterium]|jgi:2,3-bisphosphoglycerate-independent phosphoglycerate mutase|nr:cofactor-independent phosphoglycerate mutase [Sedimentisphaerales bacterium]HNY79210.1 cofactor-independent phosphoglycerate mutase [Sedimentisphaerales bacterium]HOC61498.1 cofactor-independent phosphoglycerate mutase [Sedimentisphaerales bacterium]HOH65238.1 cofactor-independent phosphoglycerate mutase [Sedimentisphaerales bacterium]HPY51972.1 cofactor-independent phosphoglycerate mutase [Sedimentisphaerales bacterium]
MTKYAIIVPDGAADEPIELFGGKTALEAAETPNMDRITTQGRQGLVRTVPGGMDPGSDVAQMSLLGYDPARYYTGRAPIEAAAQGIKLGASDWVFRCNLVTIADGKMADHSAGHITTEEGASLLRDLQTRITDERLSFHPGVSYRHLLVCRGMDFDVRTYPPHDHIGTAVEKLLPRGKGADMLIELMNLSRQVFADHDVNRVRRDLGENQVSSIWLWGQGKRAHLESFRKRFDISGAAITAVDLVRGLARLVGFDLIEVPGATGLFDTNYQGKAAAAIKALEDHDLVFVHIEAPDEASHGGHAEIKKAAIEEIDKHIVGPVLEVLERFESWRILVLPDHPTPVRHGAHSAEPVPFAMAGTGVTGILHLGFGESNAARSGFRIENGCELMEYFLKSAGR